MRPRTPPERKPLAPRHAALLVAVWRDSGTRPALLSSVIDDLGMAPSWGYSSAVVLVERALLDFDRERTGWVRVTPDGAVVVRALTGLRYSSPRP